MRIIPNHPGAQAALANHLQSLQGKAPKFEISPAFARFKAEYKEQAPEKLSWSNFRKLARAMFGESAFKDVKGAAQPKLDLQPGQLKRIAQSPSVVEALLGKLKLAKKLDAMGGLSVQGLAKLYTRSARAAVPSWNNPGSQKSVGLTVATVNDDFTDRKTNLRRVDADVVLVQEAKNTNIRKELNDKHGVHQNVASDDKQGSAVVWDKDRVKAGKRGYQLAVAPDARADIMKRWMSWTDVKVDGVKVRMISVHRPPFRDRHLWPKFDQVVARFVKQSRLPVVIGLDANDRTPTNLARLTGLKWSAPKGSIDGFLVSDGITVEKTWRLPKGTSDHHPVMATLRIKKP